ncbi:hypothetical protein AC1031_004271 [Aphanomyces cochlioides]|nr:hypothetical protein AC1031_004271 [Aphanomyces cochlioides]
MKCFFNGCENEAYVDTKCKFHMYRGQCQVPNCHSQVYARNHCARHGGKRQCQVDGCGLNCRVGNFCTRHGPAHVVRKCSELNCENQAHLRGRCFRHGGVRLCKVDGCRTSARHGGLCRRHYVLTKATMSCSNDRQLPQSIDSTVQTCANEVNRVKPMAPENGLRLPELRVWLSRLQSAKEREASPMPPLHGWSQQY